MSAELFLAVLGLVEGCIKLANEAISTCRRYCDAEQDLKDKVLILETRWTRLETQLGFLRRIKSQLTNELAQCHFDLVQKLHSTFVKAVSELEMAAASIPAKGNKLSSLLQSGRWKYAMRKTLDTLMSELESWQKLFDPSWYLILLIGGNMLDPALPQPSQTRPVELEANQPQLSPSPLQRMLSLYQAIHTEHTGSPTDTTLGRVDYNASQLLGAREESIPYSAARAIFRTGFSQVQIIEPVDLLAGTASTSTVAAVEHLARKLQHVDPDAFGLLRCSGVVKKTETINGEYQLQGLDIIYHAPVTASKAPVTLRQLLIDQPNVSLSARVHFAKQLIRSVSYIHTCDFVHKNIRPENILIFPPPVTSALSQPLVSTLGHAFLLGLSQFRPAMHQTNLLGHAAWYLNLYRHPARQGLCILDKYIMQHDIYALGVCLLEIGLWRTFVVHPLVHVPPPGEPESSRLTPAPGEVLKTRRVLTDAEFKYAHLAGATAWVKEDLVKMARGLLPQRMGELYAGVVVDCLSCLDEGSEAFGGLQCRGVEVGGGRGDGIAVGVRFLEKVLGRVMEICV